VPTEEPANQKKTEMTKAELNEYRNVLEAKQVDWYR
jgi:hypothetical protein